MSQHAIALMDAVNSMVIGKGYRLTPQRRATLEVLIGNESDHLSAEDIYLKVKKLHPEIGLATVYRTLELLSELAVVEKMHFGDGVVRYDLRASGQAHMHHHLICSRCGLVKEIQDDWLAELEARVAKEYGFAVTDHRLDFTGTYMHCGRKSCRRKAVS
ncbi:MULTISPECIES: transcriptional repressor [Paenibacillus]|uniref:Fur family transcriptional regulator n=1 Tax=Paenibacillus TaxID=44249 RepID=UPI00041A5FC8|nr:MULTISPECIES: transcriptional repressor [Paenibacillus]